MQTQPAADAAPAQARPRSTAGAHGITETRLLYLGQATEAIRASEVLLAMRASRKQGTPQHEALWEGSWALQCNHRDAILQLHKRGGLLHFAAPAVMQHIRYGDDGGGYTLEPSPGGAQ